MTRYEGAADRAAGRPGRGGRLAASGLALLALWGSGCGPESAAHAISTDAHVQLRLTDAPSDHLSAAELWISRVYLMPRRQYGNRADPVELLGPEHGGSWDLMALRDGISAGLTNSVVVPPREYTELRVVVDSARLTLLPGLHFDDGGDRRVVRPNEHDVRVQLARSLRPEGGDDVLLTLDLDVNETFALTVRPDGVADVPDGFVPVLREKGRSRGTFAAP